MFELVHLRSFVAVAEELHFGRAANRLQITQPPLSRQISLLEHQLGARLFDRSNRRVEMTPAGRAFLPEARQLLRLAESAMLSVRRAEQGEAGRLAISFTASAGYDFLPRTLRRLRRDLPGVSFILREMVSVDQLDALDARLVDIALLRPPVRRPGLESRCVLREKLVVGVPGRHRLARRSRAVEGVPAIRRRRHEHDLVAGCRQEGGVAPGHERAHRRLPENMPARRHRLSANQRLDTAD